MLPIRVRAHITIDASGQLFGWWEPVEDDLVRIDKTTGLATLVGESDPVFTGFGTRNGGLDFDNGGALYVNTAFPAHFYTVDPVLGPASFVGTLTAIDPIIGVVPVFIAHHGDFHPSTNVFYALSDQFLTPVRLLGIDIASLSVTSTVPLADEAFVITWIPGDGPPPDECRPSKKSKRVKSKHSKRSVKSKHSKRSAKSGKCKSKKSAKSEKADSECKGGVIELTLLNNGPSGIVVVTDKNGNVLFSGTVDGGTSFTFTGLDGGKMGTEITLTVDGGDPIKIHTSCSRPIGIGSEFGDFEVLGGSSRDGGPFVEP